MAAMHSRQKVFYHLGGQNEAMQFALCAGPLFTDQLASNSDYIDTLAGSCTNFLF